MKFSTAASKAVVELHNQPAFQLSLSSFTNGGVITNTDTSVSRALIRIQASDDPTTNHIPATIILTIDESGSMGNRAVRHDDSDGASGLSQLDIVKHAARTIVLSLSDQDRLAIVAFSDNARVILPLTYMTKANKDVASKKINSLTPLTCTNLYDGLLASLEMIRMDQIDGNPATNANVMLLTDGMPNINPPRGELETLRRYLDSNPEQRSIRISTFGFGYSLQSRLLFDLAQEGGSMYAFIPDASFVGTIFINSIANLLSAASPHGATLKLEAAPGIKISSCLSGHRCKLASWGAVVDIPSILYGHSIDVLVELSGSSSSHMEPFLARLEMKTGLVHPLETQTQLLDPFDQENGYFNQASIRSEIINFIKEAEIEKSLDSRNGTDLRRSQCLLENAKERVLFLSEGMESFPNVIGMRKDLDGQISQAYSQQAYYKKWGSHYVLSLAGAHTLQQCINFKDPGIQDYATGKFRAIRDSSEAIFLKLDPPKPSRRATAPVRNMGVYYSSSAPCFASGSVTKADGHIVDISQIQAGDEVVTGDSHGINNTNNKAARMKNKTARVVCVVVTPCRDGIENLVELDGGVVVTPWHPVRAALNNSSSSSWTFPCLLGKVEQRRCSAVYSFVLEGDISMRIGPYDGVALGHGVKEDPVLEHDYLGTDRVLLDLARMPGWENGLIRLAPNPAIRQNKGNGLIIGFRHSATDVLNHHVNHPSDPERTAMSLAC